MRLKKQANFSDQLQVERNMVEASSMKEAVSFIETLIIRQVCPLLSLRLLSLLSVTQDGLSSKQYRFLCKLYAQSFGHEHVVTFFNAKKVRLLFEHPSPSPAALLEGTPLGLNTKRQQQPKFRETVKKLGLIPRLPEGFTYDVKNPEDASFVYGGAFLPVICPLLDALVVKDSGPGSAFNSSEVSRCLSGGSTRVLRRNNGSNSNSSPPSSTSSSSSSSRAIAVYFVGGVTFAEISALRFWSRKKGLKVVVLTTNLVNGNSLMKSLMTIK